MQLKSHRPVPPLPKCVAGTGRHAVDIDNAEDPKRGEQNHLATDCSAAGWELEWGVVPSARRLSGIFEVDVAVGDVRSQVAGVEGYEVSRVG